LPNWCENEVLIRGPIDVMKTYKDRILKDESRKYYPYFSAVALPELKDEDEVKAHITAECDKTLFKFHYRVTDLEVIERNPEELELHFSTAYSPAKSLCPGDLMSKLSILHKYFEPMNAFHGFAHYVNGKLIASGHEECEEQDSPWAMYEYGRPA
jgi:hypothetical protein